MGASNSTQTGLLACLPVGNATWRNLGASSYGGPCLFYHLAAILHRALSELLYTLLQFSAIQFHCKKDSTMRLARLSGNLPLSHSPTLPLSHSRL